MTLAPKDTQQSRVLSVVTVRLVAMKWEGHCPASLTTVRVGSGRAASRSGFEPDHVQLTRALASLHADTQPAEAATFLNSALQPRLQKLPSLGTWPPEGGPASAALASSSRQGARLTSAVQHQLREVGDHKSPFLKLLSFLSGAFLPHHFPLSKFSPYLLHGFVLIQPLSFPFFLFLLNLTFLY